MTHSSGRRMYTLGGALALGACLFLALATPADAGEAPRLASKSTLAGSRSVPRPPAYAPAPSAGSAMTALQFAATEGLTYSDLTTYVLLESGNLRLRIYPGSNVTVLGGREYRVKDPFLRSAGDVVLSRRVTQFLAHQVSTFRIEEATRLSAASTPQHSYAPLPPLPQRRRQANRTPLPVRTQPAPAPAVEVRPYAATGQASWVPQAKERPWKWIVIHHSDDMSGNMEKYDNFHRNVNHWENGCGYHFVIGNGSLSGDGEVEIGPRWGPQIQGAHAKVPGNRYNERGIGICLVGDFDKGDRQPTPAQLESLVQLVRWLRDRYGIAESDVHGHCECCSTACPGRNFPWDEVRRRIR